MTTYAAAFDSWKFARSCLEHAVQSYFDACVALHDALTAPSVSLMSDQPRLQTLAKLDSELLSSISYEQTLQKARSHLLLARNTFPPICSLPSDVLYMILARVCQLDTRIRPMRMKQTFRVQVTTLSGVCTSWRRLMIESPSFWTSIKVDIRHGDHQSVPELAKLWSSRCADAGLDLAVRVLEIDGTEVDDTEINDTESEPSQDSTDFALALHPFVPLMQHVHSLNVWASSESDIRALLELWVAHGTVGRASSLAVNASGLLNILSISRDQAGATVDIDEGTFTGFFSSLSRLVLYNVWIGWHELMQAGLVELRLEDMYDVSPTLQDLIVALKATPRLRVLSMSWVVAASYYDRLDTVALNELQVLRLGRWDLLGAITSTSESLDLCLDGFDDRTAFAARLFLSRVKVTRLYTNLSDSSGSALLLTPMRHLRALAVEKFSFLTEASDIGMESPSVNIWPELREVHLIDCIVDSETLRRLMSIHPARTLIWYCGQSDDPHRLASLESVEAALSGTGITVVMVEEEEDLPTNSWRCMLRPKI